MCMVTCLPSCCTSTGPAQVRPRPAVTAPCTSLPHMLWLFQKACAYICPQSPMLRFSDMNWLTSNYVGMSSGRCTVTSMGWSCHKFRSASFWSSWFAHSC